MNSIAASATGALDLTRMLFFASAGMTAGAHGELKSAVRKRSCVFQYRPHGLLEFGPGRRRRHLSYQAYTLGNSPERPAVARGNPDRGVGLIPVTGCCSSRTDSLYILIGNDRDSGNLKGFLRQTAAKFNQSSFLHKPAETTRISEICVQDRRDLGDWRPENISEFYSILRGEPVVFERVIFERTLTFMSAIRKAHGLPVDSEV